MKYAQLCHNKGLWSVPRAFSTILIIKYPRLSGSYCLFIADKNLKSQRSCASFHQNNERSGSCSVGMARGRTPSCDLNGDVRPDRVWFSGCFVLNRVSISSLSVLNRVSLHCLMAETVIP